jgi:DNA-binding response OmpR family regulator
MDRERTRRSSRALLVDDDVATSPLHVQRLTKRGYEVTAAPNAEAGLQLARRSPPDVIFVHVGRKGQGGSAFIQGLRADDVTRHVPVVILNTEYDPRLQRLGLTTHADGFW